MTQPTRLILQVEDSEDDVFMMKRVLKKTGVEDRVRIAWNGQEAIDYLTAALAAGPGGEAPLPFLILLDLKLPYRDGFEVLEWIRAQPRLAELPVVVLTGSNEARDRRRALELGAQAYLVKPAALDDMRRLLAPPGRAPREPPRKPAAQTDPPISPPATGGA